MLINTANIPEEGLHLQFAESENWLYENLPDRGRIDFSAHEISVQCIVKKDLKNVSVEGEASTGLELKCSRCLEKFYFPVRTKFTYVLIPAESTGEEVEKELTHEDFNFGFYRDNVIELDQIVVEQIILQIPVKPLCKDTCRGLCPVCGVNLNTEKCNHQTKIIDSPFAVLKNLKVKKER